MAGLERYRGHFYNWYDTQTLQAAAAALHFHGGQRQPRRPSADPAAGLLALPDEPILGRAGSRACDDTSDSARGAGGRFRAAPHGGLAGTLAPFRQRLASAAQARPTGLTATRRLSGVARDDGRGAGRGSDRARRGRRERLVAVVGPAMSRHPRRAAVPGAVAGGCRLSGPVDAMPTLRELARLGLRVGALGKTAGPTDGQGQRTTQRRGGQRDPARPARRARERIAASSAGPASRRAGRDGLRLPVRRIAPPARDRLQRQRAPPDASYYDLLASEARLAQLSSASPRASCRRRAGSRWAAC